MTTTQIPARPAAAATPAPPRGWRDALRWFGYLCLMTAAGLAGYVGWLLWGTGLETERAQTDLRSSFTEEIGSRPPPEPSAELHLPGDAYAQIQIPAIDVDLIVVQGTDHESLKKGPGHYVDTADPWDGEGRVGIAGHRTTYLHPFADLDDLTRGDEITLRTEFGTFAYEVTRNFVIPSAGSGRVLATTDRPTLVLTTCHPKYSSAERLIVTASLVS